MLFRMLLLLIVFSSFFLLAFFYYVCDIFIPILRIQELNHFEMGIGAKTTATSSNAISTLWNIRLLMPMLFRRSYNITHINRKAFQENAQFVQSNGMILRWLCSTFSMQSLHFVYYLLCVAFVLTQTHTLNRRRIYLSCAI